MAIQNPFPMLAASNKDGRRLKSVRDGEDSKLRTIERRRNRLAEKRDVSREVREMISRVQL